MTEITTIDSDDQALTTADSNEQTQLTQVDQVTQVDHQTAGHEPQNRNYQIGVSDYDVGVDGNWKNRAGIPMESQDIQQFIDRSERYTYQRGLTISDERDLSEREAGEAARDSVGKFFEDAPARDFVYSVEEQEQGQGTEVNVVMTGDRDDLAMDREQIEEFHALTESYYEEVENGLSEEQRQDLQRQRVEDMDRWRREVEEHDFDIGVGRTTGEMANDLGL